jgi:hypothetical protein
LRERCDQARRNQGKNGQGNVTPFDLKIQNQRDGYDMPKKNEDVLQPMVGTTDFDILDH